LASCIYEEALRLSQGLYDNEVTVDVFQTGSGTGLNMNVNEVIASHARKRCNREVHAEATGGLYHHPSHRA